MKFKIENTYVMLIAVIAFVFSQFVACGAELYQVSMKNDYDSNKVDPAAYTSTSPQFGMHSPNGWISLPIAFKTGMHLTDDQIVELKKAIAIWEKAVGKTLFQFVGRHDGIDGDSFKDLYSSLTDNINGNYSDGNWGKTGKPVEVLATTIWATEDASSRRISTADIRFNMEHYLIGDSYKLKRSETLEVVDMQSLALHELGHLLGLTHISSEVDRLSIMNPTLYIGEGLTTRRISEEDIRRIQKIYGCEGSACDVEKTYDELLKISDAEEIAAASK